MKFSVFSTALCAVMLAGTCGSFAQDDAAATAGNFPLAAKAGVDSHADKVAPPGAVNQGPFDMNKWKYGPAFNAPAGSKIWNPVKVKMMQGGKVTGVETSRGFIATPKVLCAVAGHTPRILDMVGLRTPIYIHPLQAMVSEPVKPWLDPIIVSGSLHVYVSQTARGELVMGASLDPYELHQARSTLDFVEGLCAHMLDMFPFLGDVKINRQWAGLADMTPDFAPIMGVTPLEGFYLDAGWGTWGFKATPVCGKTMSHTVATGRNHPLIEGFTIDRFSRYLLTGEKGAASVGH